MPSHARTVTRTTHRVRNALLVVLLLLVVCAAAAGFSGFKLYKSAMSAKAHLNNVVNAAKVIKDGSTDDMVKALSDVSYIQKEAAAAKQDVSGGLWTLAEKMPVVGGDVKTARTAIGTIDDFAQTTLPQLGKVVTTLTGASLSSGDGQLNMEPIIAAAQQLATVDQSVQSQARTIQDLPDAKLGVVNNALQNGKTQMAALAQVTENLSGMLNMLPNFLGANGARNYVLLAQTNSEIRGTGGLIGSAGSFSADNGKIAVGEFHADAEFPSNAALDDVNQDGDGTLYSGLYFGQVIHNLSSTPDFPRVASMAQKFWQAAPFGGSSDGVMSLDPVALQAMIDATGDVTLSDGRVLNGSNTAQTVAHLFSDMNTQKLMTVAKTMLRMAEQRHLYFWSFHEEDQAVLRSAGVTGEITNDAKNPVAGVYLNEMQASKMDWYIQRKSTVKRTGDNTYHVTYSFTNTLQPGEAGSLPEYITANAKGGVAVNRVVIYTPAGGEVSNVSASNGSSFAQVQAKDHMTYMDDISLAPQDTVTIEYDVTTAAGSANLKLDQTPTIGDPAITYEY